MMTQFYFIYLFIYFLRARYVSHNAYILVAVHDVSFCDGAQQAFELTISNIGQVAVVAAVVVRGTRLCE